MKYFNKLNIKIYDAFVNGQNKPVKRVHSYSELQLYTIVYSEGYRM